MEVLKDCTKFEVTFRCSHCGSVLKSSDPKDFKLVPITKKFYNKDYSDCRVWPVGKELKFDCRACGKQNKVSLQDSGLTPLQIEQIQSKSLPATSE
jgi:predicted RNA-binding Zn-ribbon protein involved in translation (DUF1610 family)